MVLPNRDGRKDERSIGSVRIVGIDRVQAKEIVHRLDLAQADIVRIFAWRYGWDFSRALDGVSTLLNLGARGDDPGIIDSVNICRSNGRGRQPRGRCRRERKV